MLATFGAVGVGGAGSGAHGHPGEPYKLTKRRMVAANLAATRKHCNYHFFHHSIITIYTIAISQHRPQSPYKSPVSATAQVSELQWRPIENTQLQSNSKFQPYGWKGAHADKGKDGYRTDAAATQHARWEWRLHTGILIFWIDFFLYQFLNSRETDLVRVVKMF